MVEEDVAVVEEDIRISNQLLILLNLVQNVPSLILFALNYIVKDIVHLLSFKESHEKDSKSKQGTDKRDKVHLTFSRASVDVNG